MHGVKRVRITPEALAARKKKEEEKLRECLKLTDVVLNKKQADEWSREAFSLTTQLLTMNPEFYTVWNYRRDILTNGIFTSINPQEKYNTLCDELGLTMSFLRQHPKVYWIWNHRRWCLENVPDGPSEEPGKWRAVRWNEELYAVEKMLEIDARNFHCWNYRRYVLASMPVRRSNASEIAYTTKKIESNFSNFSAWHQRSKVLLAMWESGELDEKASKDEEFEFVKQALYVDPNDQSAWIYHRWLVGDGHDKALLQREIGVIQELAEIEPDSKWCMESLVHYKRILLKHHMLDVLPAEKEAMAADCMHMLEALIRIDPQRQARYRSLVTDIQGKQ